MAVSYPHGNLTSNVTQENCRRPGLALADVAVHRARPAGLVYSSSVCSNTSPGDLVARIGSAIDQLAEAADAAAEPAGRDLAVRLAQAWALIAEADPELAERAERYLP